MARANNNGWDFLEVGKTYQYKEDSMIAMVRILEDNSDEEFYDFYVEVVAANMNIAGNKFNVSHTKKLNGVYSGMSQFYKSPEYVLLPLGTPYPYALEGHEMEGLETIKGFVE